MEPATGALIASAIVGGIGAYGARSQSKAALVAEDVASGGLISRTQADLASAAAKAKQLEAEVAKLKSEVARCQGLQSQLDALSGPELAFKNAKAEVLRRAGVEFLLPELVPSLPDAASIEKMKKVLDYPTELVDTLNRMTLRKFYETRVLKAVPAMAPVPSAPPAVAAPGPPSEMDAELEALRGGRSRRRTRQSRRTRRRRGGADGDEAAPAIGADGQPLQKGDEVTCALYGAQKTGRIDEFRTDKYGTLYAVLKEGTSTWSLPASKCTKVPAAAAEAAPAPAPAPAQSEFAREAEIGTLAAQFPTPAAPAPAPPLSRFGLAPPSIYWWRKKT